ncbi:MAG: MarR family transcriptional regulator [Clostridia bacterium]|nr:MarR family transcriptional regulator [Clostridia bacterium]
MQYEQLLLKNQLCFPIYACSREIIKAYKPFLDEIGLTYTQYIVMMVLWECGSVTAKALGSELHLDSGTLTPLLKRLEGGGLLTRARAVDDERSLIVSLTEQGAALEARAADIPRRMGACVDLSADEAATLYRLLYRVLGNVAHTCPTETHGN